jgi:DNA (cytosine-5)-methyltransferase 1
MTLLAAPPRPPDPANPTRPWPWPIPPYPSVAMARPEDMPLPPTSPGPPPPPTPKPGVRPRLLDLFAGEGGSAYGYALAGFDVTAVDDQERPSRAPDVTWVTGDATTYPLDGFDVITASPPCTDHSTLRTVADVKRKNGGAAGTGWMLQHTLDRLREFADRTGAMWVVENVEGARATIGEGWLLKRHRYFASNAFLMAPGPCRCHGRDVIGVYGELVQKDRRCAGKRLNRPNGDLRAGVGRARRLMGMPWASATGLPLAIPPAYTRYVGEQLMAHLSAAVAR